MRRNRLSLILNAAIIVLVLTAWFSMMFSRHEGLRLSSVGLASLKYVTVLSNLLACFAAAVYLICLLRRKVPFWVIALKYMAAASVGLTFLVVVLFLGFLYGFAAMFRGANLIFHLIVPLLAMAEFIFCLPAPLLRLRDALTAVVPMILYGFFYLGNILLNGVGAWPNTNDWYGFCLWGFPVGLGIFAFLILFTCGLARLLAWGNQKAHRFRG